MVRLSSARFTCGIRYRSGKTYTITLGQVGRAAPLRLGVVPVHRDGAFAVDVRIPSGASPGESFIIVGGTPSGDCRDTSPGSCAGYTVRLEVLPSK